ncbi:hypothetical protein [Dubosiella newyorkensis]|uniref:hypothetical protein n=1 Tax=Dubosiella newyorkensis TaxID=1862672 RepID=UPI003F67D147
MKNTTFMEARKGRKWKWKKWGKPCREAKDYAKNEQGVEIIEVDVQAFSKTRGRRSAERDARRQSGFHRLCMNISRK